MIHWQPAAVPVGPAQPLAERKQLHLRRGQV